MKRDTVARQRAKAMQQTELRRNGAFFAASLVGHVILLLLLPSLAVPAPPRMS